MTQTARSRAGRRLRRGPLAAFTCLVLALPSSTDSLPRTECLDPVAALLERARGAHAAGELGLAHDLLLAALELAPGEAGTRLWLARVLNDLGLGERALESLAAASAQAPRSAWHELERARALLSLGRADDAEGALRAALAVYPGFGTARLRLAELLLDAGVPEAALEELGALLETCFDEAPVVVLHARVLDALAREPEADARLRAALEQAPVRLALCHRLARAGRYAEAWEIGASLASETTDGDARLLLAQVARRADRPLEALALLGALLLEDPTHALALAELGELFHHAPDLEARVAERRVAARPEDVDAWGELLESDLRVGRVEELLTRALEIPAALLETPRLARILGEAYRRAGRPGEARTMLEPLCEAQDARACYELGLLAYAEARWEEAVQAFERGAQGAAAADAHFNRGVCLARLGRHAEAARAWREAVRSRPGFGEAWLQLGHGLRWRSGEPERAREAYRRYLELGGDDPEVRRFVDER